MNINAQFSLHNYETAVNATMDEVVQDKIVSRIWQKDHTVWQSDPAEITNRLGWLHSPETLLEQVDRIGKMVTAVRADGFTRVLLFGMGGSSLAPEMFHKIFGESCDGLPLAVVDSTDADAVRAHQESGDLRTTLFIVATKSGGTVETLSAFKYFYNQVAALVGEADAGKQFIAITDPGSKLVDIATQYGFRDTFINDPNIGGRYAVLSFFGIVPAALIGIDIATLLSRAAAAAADSKSADSNYLGAKIGVIMGELAKAGRDKMTFISSPPIAPFGDWVEQLIAESTGKNGQGILPVVGESFVVPTEYGQDRLFVYLHLAGDESHDATVAQIKEAEHPLIVLELQDLYSLGAQFFLWEMATAVSGYRLGIQPFDQPNVEAAKILARKMVAQFMETGELPEGNSAELTAENLDIFLAQAQTGDYISIHAYVPQTAVNDHALATLRQQLLSRYNLATTVGYGPRFLHSTGQLHKGDSGNGLFIQLVSDAQQTVSIPDEAGKPDSAMSFNILKNAQALGDSEALQAANRRIIRFHLGTDIVAGLKTLSE